jgi:hypothetical protein
MYLKKGASLEGASAKTISAVEIVNKIYESFGHELVVTSGTEGHRGDKVHGDNSKHYTGDAFDCRTRIFVDEYNVRDEPKIKAVAKAIREALGKEYDVVIENTHIHVEYDPKLGSGTLASDLKNLIDLVFKFIGDFTPFYRSLEKLVKSIVGKIKK